jgi:hypothetical protein
MNHSPAGTAQPVTDSVQRAMKFLKDRPLPQPKAQTRQNMGRGRPATQVAERSPSPIAHQEQPKDNAQQQPDQTD